MTYRRGSLGPEVARIQTRLREVGRYLGPVDGVYGGGTESAVRAFQAAAHLTVDGAVGPSTWAALMSGAGPIPTPAITTKPLDYRCLALTGAFETDAPIPDCFSGLAGDFDGMGISFGALQFNLGQGTLQPLLVSLDRRNPAVITEVFHDNAAELRAALAATPDEQVTWARSIQDSVRHRVVEPWRGLFIALGQRPECQQVQVEGAAVYYSHALDMCRTFDVGSERGVALMFDIATQNGSISAVVRAQIMSDVAALPPQKDADAMEVAKLRIIATRRAEAANPKWIADTRQRKMTIAEGAGVVHGMHVDLEQDYGIRLVRAPIDGGARSGGVPLLLSGPPPMPAATATIAVVTPVRVLAPPAPVEAAVVAPVIAPLSEPTVSDTARWADDTESPDYRHLGEPLRDDVFVVTSDTIRRLCALNAFDTTAGQDALIIGLRGCRLADERTGLAGIAPRVSLTEAVPDHNDYRCVMLVWRQMANALMAFPASTVPNWVMMQTQRANLLPTGRYVYRVSARGTTTEHPQPGALCMSQPIGVRISPTGTSYTIHDEWDYGEIADDIHAGRFDRPRPPLGGGPFFASAGCQTLPGAYAAGVPVRAWAGFQAALGLSTPLPPSDDGLPFVYILLTGREARLASIGADDSALHRLRFGSRSPLVTSLRAALAAAGFPSAATADVFSVEMLRPYADWQRAQRSGASDGILTPAQATMLGVNPSF